MSTTLFAGERLEHPAITRAVHADGRIIYGLIGSIDREAAAVLGKLVRIDLLEARGGNRPVRFVLDLERAGYLDSRALESLRDTSKLVIGETRGHRLEFINANDDLRAHLTTAKFGNCFDVHAPGEQPRRIPEAPV